MALTKKKLAIVNSVMWLYQRLTGRPKNQLPALLNFQTIVIFSTTALGDLMFNTPAIYQLRQRFPNARLLLVVHKKYVNLVQNYADVDEVLCWNGQFARLLSILWSLRPFKPDLAVILHSRAPYDVLCATLAGCCWIVRDRDDSGGQPMRRWLAAAADNDFNGHCIRRKLALLKLLGCSEEQVTMRVPCKVDTNRFRVLDVLRVGFQLGASKLNKTWPVECFVTLSESLLQARPDCQIVLNGTEQEIRLARQFLALLPAHWHSRVVSMVGATSVKDAFDLVASLDLLVTGDTGPLHLAIAQKIPTVSLYVGTYPEDTGPCQDLGMHTIIHRPLPADAPEALRTAPMMNVPVDAVLAAVLQALSARKPRIFEKGDTVG